MPANPDDFEVVAAKPKPVYADPNDFEVVASPAATEGPASTSPAQTEQVSAAKPAGQSAPILSQVEAIPETVADALAQTGMEAAAGAEFAHAEVLRRAGEAGQRREQAIETEREQAAKLQDTMREKAGLSPTNKVGEVARANLQRQLAKGPDEATAMTDTASGISEDAANRGATAAPGVITTVARGLAKGAGMAATAAIPGVGLPLMATEGAAQAYGAAKAAGKNEHDAESAGVRTLVALAVFGGANKAVSAGIAKYLGNTPALKRFLVNVLGQDAGNEVASRVISAGEAAMDAPEGKKLQAAAEAAKKFDLESSAQNLGFAVLGAAHAGAPKESPETTASNNAFAEKIRMIPDTQFDAAIKQYRTLPETDPRKAIFEAEIVRRGEPDYQPTSGTPPPEATSIPAAPALSATPQAPDVEQVSQPKGGTSNLFKQARRERAADTLSKTADAAKDVAPEAADAAAKLAEKLKEKGAIDTKEANDRLEDEQNLQKTSERGDASPQKSIFLPSGRTGYLPETEPGTVVQPQQGRKVDEGISRGASGSNVSKGDLEGGARREESTARHEEQEPISKNTSSGVEHGVEVIFDNDTIDATEDLRDKFDPKRRTAHVFKFPADTPRILYRGISRQELDAIKRNPSADIMGGTYSTRLEQQHGAQYALTPAEAVRAAFHNEKEKGVKGQQKYLLKVDASGKTFAHLDPRPTTTPELAEKGRYIIPAERISGNLGVSVKIPFKDVLSVEELGTDEKVARAKYKTLPPEAPVETPAPPPIAERKAPAEETAAPKESAPVEPSVPQSQETPGATEPPATPYSRDAVKGAFGLTDDQADATHAIVEALGLDTTRMKIQKGDDGTPTGITLHQPIVASPKYRSLFIDRSGEIHGTTKPMSHESILKQLGINAADEDDKEYQRRRTERKALARGVLEGDTLHIETPGAGITPRQRTAAKEFAEDHGLEVLVDGRRLADFRGASLFQDAKGAVTLHHDGVAVVQALTDPDASTALHEFYHVAEEQILLRDDAFAKKARQKKGITDEDVAAYKEWAGHDADTIAGREKAARAFERYLRDGEAPTQKLQTVFAKLAKYLRDIYRRLSGSPIADKVSPEAKAMFDKMLGDDKPTEDLTPAIRTPDGILTGENHGAIIGEHGLDPALKDSPESGFVDKDGNFLTREQAAEKTGLPTDTEEGKLHSSDLPEAIKENAEPEPPQQPKKSRGRQILEDLGEDEPKKTEPVTEQPPEPKKSRTTEENITALKTELAEAIAEKRTRDVGPLKKRIKALEAAKPAKPEVTETHTEEQQENPTLDEMLKKEAAFLAEKEGQKELWQMNRKEAAATGKRGNAYMEAVKQAVKEGKPVPWEVLDQFKLFGWAREAAGLAPFAKKGISPKGDIGALLEALKTVEEEPKPPTHPTLESDNNEKPYLAKTFERLAKEKSDDDIKKQISAASFYIKHGKSISIEQRMQIGAYYREALTRGMDIPASEILDKYVTPTRTMKRGNPESGASTLIPDIAEKVANAGRYAYEKGMDAAKWAANMAKAFGEKVRPYLAAAWRAIRGESESGAIGAAGGGSRKMGAEQKAFIESVGKPALREAAKAMIEAEDAGWEDADAVNFAVNKLRELVPAADEESARRFFSPAAFLARATGEPVIDQTVYHSTVHPGNLSAEAPKTSSSPTGIGLYTSPVREDAEGWGGSKASVRPFNLKLNNPVDLRDVPLDQVMTREQLAKTLTDHGFPVVPNDIPESEGDTKSPRSFDEWKPHIEALTRAMHAAGFDGLLDKTYVNGKEIEEHIPFSEKSLTAAEPKPIQYVIPERAAAHGDKLVSINIAKFDPAFQKDKGFYLSPTGEGEVPGRRAGFEAFLKTGKPVEAPEVFVGDRGEVAFTNGRHRYSVIRDQGEKSMPMAMSPESEANARKFGLLEETKTQGGDSVEKEQTENEEKGRQEVLTAGEGDEVPSQSPEPSDEIPEDPTGIQNAVTEALRDKYGFEERAKVLRKAFPDLVDLAKAKLAENPEAGMDLVDELSKKVRPLTDEEDALLTLELANRQTAFEKSEEAQNLPDADAKTAERLAQARQKLFEILGIAENVGTENARGLNARKLMINRDFSLAALLRKETRARGRELYPDEQAKVVEQAKEIDRLKKELERKQETERQLAEAQELTRTYEATIADMKKQAKKRGKAAKEPIEKRITKPLSESIIAFARSARDSALARIRERRGRMFADPLGVMSAIDLADHAIVGATHLIEGAVTFGKWANKMREDFGDAIKPHLRLIFDASKEQARKILDKPEKTPDQIKARAKAEATAGEELSHQTVAELARAHINAGIHGEDNVMKAVHADIKESYPNATERDVRRAFSEYGKVKFPSKDAVDKELRELRTLTRLQESIDRETSGLDALHSGMQRDKATQSIREKQRRLNELLKARQGPDSPEKLASRDAAKQTALRYAIADLDKQLRTGEKPSERSATPDSPATEQLRAERDAMREKLREIEAETNPKKSEAEKQIAQLSKVKERLDELLSGKRDPKQSKDFNPLSQAAEDIKAEIHAMQELAAQMKRDAKPRGDPGRAAEQAKIKALEDSIERYQQKTAAKDFTTASGVKLGPDTPEVARLREIRDSRRLMYEAVKKAGLPVKTPDEIYNARRLPQINNRIAELEARKTAGDFEPRPKKTPRPPTAEVAAASAKLDAAKKEIQKGWEKIQHERRSKPQRAWDAFKQMLKSITAVTTAGHGTVGMITHAGALIWRPSRAAIYWKNFGRQFPMWANKGFHERAIYALKNDPDFEAWKDAGASIDPDRTYTDYGLYAKWLGKLAAGGERGFDALKLTRLALNKADWESVSPEIKANPEAAAETRKAIAAINNKATGAIPKTSPFAEPAARNKMETATYNLSKNPLADAVLFAPRLYASRWMRVVYDPVKTVGTFADWNNASPAERTAATTRAKHAAEFAAVYVGALLTNQAILSATGSDQKVNLSDPTKRDWLKFKGGGKEILADGGLLDPIRLIGQIVWGDLVNNRTASEKFRYSSRYAKAVHDAGQYLRGKLNPTLGLAVDSVTGKDFTDRPLPWNKEPQNAKEAEYHPRYTWAEWLAEHGPIPIAGGTKVVYDEMRKRGLSAPQAKDIINGAAATAFEMTGLHINDEKKPSQKRNTYSAFR
ncbi:MAG: hypothetical protein WBD81_17890 [Collimonas pratensis]|uniref:hypothetical protein n=1 Tax=Collimonas pratensis TaxID=279113 RepID=UPI003C77C40A